MNMGFTGNVEVDADALEDLLDSGMLHAPSRQAKALSPKQPAPANHILLQPQSPSQLSWDGRERRRARVSAAAQAMAAADAASGGGDDLLLEANGRSIPDSVVISKAAARMAATVGPVLAADVLALAISGVMACAALWLASQHGLMPVNSWPLPLPLLALAALPLVAYWFFDLYGEVWLHPACELRHLSRATTAGWLAAAAGGIAAAGPAAGPLAWCGAAWAAALVTVPAVRAIVRRYCAGRGWWGYPTLVITDADDADPFARLLLRDPWSGLQPVLANDPLPSRSPSAVGWECVLPVVNNRTILESIVRSQGIRHAIVHLPAASATTLENVLDRYRGLVPHLLVLPTCPPVPALWRAARHGGRPSGLEVRNGLLLDSLQVAKRTTDLAMAAAVLLVIWPLLLMIAVLIRLSDRGPALFGHTRVGRHGKPFRAWKFRTMRVGADEIIRRHLEAHPEARAEWERDHKLRNDPRVTRIGALLRKTSLDELPQIWNVLRGEMSLVGPRPIIGDEVRHYDEVIRLYALVRPGITGLWQVSGRNDTTYPERVALDRFYVRHWSPWLDLYILARTITTLLSRGGAY